MKTITYTIIFFLLTTSIIAQNYSLSDLIKINNNNLDDFDTFVTQRGYKYYESKGCFVSKVSQNSPNHNQASPEIIIIRI